MRFILLIVLFLMGWAHAATSAYFLHHEQSTQAGTEADCQNRELCLDKQNLAPLGRFNDGTLWHGVTQEKPNVNLTGTLTVTGATVLSNNLTMSLLGINLPVFTNGSKQLTTNPITGTGNVVLSASPTITTPTISSPTITGTIAGASETLSGTLGVTGVSTFTAAPVFSSVTASLPLFTNGVNSLVSNPITGTGNVVLSASPTITTPTISSPTITGTIAGASQTLSGTLGVTGNVNINGATDAAGYSVNVLGNAVAVSTASNGFFAFGAGNPSAGTNAEFLNFYHDGVNAVIRSTKNGTGTARPLLIQTAGTTAITVAANQAVTLSSTLAVTGSTTLTGGLTSSAGGGYEEGSFTAALTGMASCAAGTFSANTCTGTATFSRIGKNVSIKMPPLNGTSNTTGCTITGLPASIQGGGTSFIQILDNTTASIGYINMASGTMPLYLISGTSFPSTFTASGIKGINVLSGGYVNISYTIN